MNFFAEILFVLILFIVLDLVNCLCTKELCIKNFFIVVFFGLRLFVNICFAIFIICNLCRLVVNDLGFGFFSFEITIFLKEIRHRLHLDFILILNNFLKVFVVVLNLFSK